MKLILKQTVIDKMMVAYHEAKRNMREPDCFALSHREYDEFRSDMRYNMYDSRPYMHVRASDRIDMDFKRRDMAPSWTVMSDFTFMGVPVFVVPDEYLPD